LEFGLMTRMRGRDMMVFLRNGDHMFQAYHGVPHD
jgi:hypothetical protein